MMTMMMKMIIMIILMIAFIYKSASSPKGMSVR